MAICSICGGHHHAASCKHRLKSSAQRLEPKLALPLALSNDELDALAYRAKENRPLSRVDLDRLIAVAREFNQMQKARPASAPAVNIYGGFAP